MLERVGVAEQEAVTACAPQRASELEAAAERQRYPILPAARHVVPAAIEEVFGSGTVHGCHPVDDGLVVALEEPRHGTGLRPLRLEEDGDEMTGALRVDERERPSVRCGILPVPDGIEPSFVLAPSDGHDAHFSMYVYGWTASAHRDELDSGGPVPRHRQIQIVLVVRGSGQQCTHRRTAPRIPEEV